jgi:uncharacterized protein YdeI (YjbR/CyaY-like superfamily)
VTSRAEIQINSHNCRKGKWTEEHANSKRMCGNTKLQKYTENKDNCTPRSVMGIALLFYFTLLVHYHAKQTDKNGEMMMAEQD